MARSEDARPAVAALEDLCRDLTERLGLLGAAVNLTSGRGSAGVVAASDERSRRIDELQFSAGEGPSYDAVIYSRPVLTPDLGADGGRWPGYTSTAIEAGVEGVFAFPLQVGALCLGVLDVYAARSGSLSDEQIATTLTATRRAIEILLDGAPGLGDEIDQRAEIYQAQGMLMAARGIDAAEALARMRAHAFAHGQQLHALALFILAGEHFLEDE
jgi:hypothetical protein